MSDTTSGPRSDGFAAIRWEADNTPVSEQFDDPYFAREDGRAETRHVFLAGNGLPERWQSCETFTIGELGFGTGLNFLETLQTWQLAPGASEQLRFVSFERYPMTAEDLQRALTAWPDLNDVAGKLLEQWPELPECGVTEVSFGAATLELHLGDANTLVAQWAGQADAWYLDGFSPAKNADLWSSELMAAVCARTAAGGTFATYTVAGWVRRNLIAAGFEVQKVPGFGRKRESLMGRRTLAAPAGG